MALTRALVLRHASNRQDSYDVALLDVAQDHALFLMQTAGVFDAGRVIFKGGTSLRKCRLGSSGRFSTDIDLAAPNDDDVFAVCTALDGQSVGGFKFTVRDGEAKDGRKWWLDLEHATLGNVAGLARLEFARRRPARAPEVLRPLHLPIHDQYDFALQPLPVIAEVEACAEKLARYRRSPPLARDLYDLAWFASRPIDEALLRRLWVLKVYSDVVEDGRGNKPLTANDVLDKRDLKDLQAAEIGVLTQPKDIPGWDAKVRARFAFLADMDRLEADLASCNARHRQEVHQLLVSGGF